MESKLCCITLGGMELIERLKADGRMKDDKECMAALVEMETLLRYCALYGVHHQVLYY